MPKKHHLSPFRILAVAPPGTCKECAKDHPPEFPHDCESMCYQYRFYDQHGRFPTWDDAMAHCTQEMKDLFMAEMNKQLEARKS